MALITSTANAHPPEAEMEPLVEVKTLAPVDVAAIQAAAERDGRVTLEVGGVSRTLLLHEHEIVPSWGREVYQTHEDGRRELVDYVTAKTFQGRLEGVEASASFVTLDAPKDAIRGTLYVDSRLYYFRTVEVEGVTLLETSWDESKIAPVPDLSKHVHSGEMTVAGSWNDYSYVRPVASAQYAQDLSWTTHVADAFNQQHAMWDNQVYIHLVAANFVSMPNDATTDCYVMLDKFDTYVANQGWTSGYIHDAYQLFAHNNFGNCLGLATTTPYYDSYLTLRSANMASILEAHDHSWFDSYDPDNSYHLGLISAQELSHNYGEWEHSSTCRAWNAFGNCTDFNVMASSSSFNERNFWWNAQSHDRIYHDFHLQR